MVKPWPIEIDGLPNLKMVDLSMANWQGHNQMVVALKSNGSMVEVASNFATPAARKFGPKFLTESTPATTRGN